MAGIVPVPKGAQIAIQNNYGEQKELDKPSPGGSWRSAEDRLREIHDATEPKLLSPSHNPRLSTSAAILTRCKSWKLYWRSPKRRMMIDFDNMSHSKLVDVAKSQAKYLLYQSSNPPIARCPFCDGSGWVPALKLSTRESMPSEWRRDVTQEEYETYIERLNEASFKGN